MSKSRRSPLSVVFFYSRVVDRKEEDPAEKADVLAPTQTPLSSIKKRNGEKMECKGASDTYNIPCTTDAEYHLTDQRQRASSSSRGPSAPSAVIRSGQSVIRNPHRDRGFPLEPMGLTSVAANHVAGPDGARRAM